MSQPKLPDKPNFTREDVINQILASIAMEELGLSHIINAEGEKLQYLLGTIEGANAPTEPATVEDLLEVNKSIRETSGSTIHIQMLLRGKMERISQPAEIRPQLHCLGLVMGAVGVIRTGGWVLPENYWLYFTGGIGLVYDPNPEP